MMLLTKAIRRRMPMLYAQEGKGDDAIVHLKLFSIAGRYTLYVTEAAARLPDGSEVSLASPDAAQAEDVILFGYCFSALGADCDEWGYTSLNELQRARHPVFRALPVIERDRHFEPRPMAEVRREIAA